MSDVHYTLPQLTVGRADQAAGTAGCIVGRRGFPGRYLLSCSHVLAWNLHADPTATDTIVWPAKDADNMPAAGSKPVATLACWAPAMTVPQAATQVDAAIAELQSGALVDQLTQIVPTPLRIGKLKADDIVYHQGARSGRRSGQVKIESFPWDPTYIGLKSAAVSMHFQDLVVCKSSDGAPFSEDGDSGSAVFRDAAGGGPPELVGLVIGFQGDRSVVCRIEHIFDALGIGIWSDITGKSPPAGSIFGPSPNPTPAAIPAVPSAVPGPPAAPATPGPLPQVKLIGAAIDNLTEDRVVKIFTESFRSNVKRYLDTIKAALIEKGLTDAQMVAMAIGTICAETGQFDPIKEPRHKFNTSVGSDHNYDIYDHKNGNLGPPDGATFCGRGFVQLTGRENYARYGAMIKVDLIAVPDAALDPVNAARLLAAFLFDHQDTIRAALKMDPPDDMANARKAVNGGGHGLGDFTRGYTACLAAVIV